MSDPIGSRGDLCLHEDEDENEQGRQNAGSHHPDRELTVRAQWVDHPAPFHWTGHAEAVRNAQLL